MRTILVLRPAPLDAADLACVADLAAIRGDERRTLVLADLPPPGAATGAQRSVKLLRLSASRWFSPQAAVERTLAALAPGGVLAIDAFAAPENLPIVLRTIAVYVFSLATPPTVCVVFAPSSHRFYVAKQLFNAFRLRLADAEQVQPAITEALITAHFVRLFGPVGLRLGRLLSQGRSRVRRLLTS